MLRNEQKQELKQMENSSECIIVGGGISGLIIATLLQRRGMKVTVLDKGRGIGGRLATRRINYSEAIKQLDRLIRCSQVV